MLFGVKVCLILFFISESWCQIIVKTLDGQVQGSISQTKTQLKYYSFFGIPYAQPPVGDLRFQAPKAAEAWDDILDATSFKNICYQVTYDTDSESEDCLFVNVFSPQLVCEDSLLPVMVYIHGGGFIGGNGWVGAEFLIESGVILVSINYRLGPFGFFSTGDTVIPGNAGLKDQVLALQWVQKNIKSFCGDPDQVTIFGQSAGGASVSYHLLSPKSKGLFRAAIAQSGSAISPWAYQRDQVNITLKTAALIDEKLADVSSTELLSSLLKVNASEIDAASNKIFVQDSPENWQIQQGFYYAPVIEVDHDDAFITELMYESFAKGDINAVPLMIGITGEEYLGWVDSGLMEYHVYAFDNNIGLFVPRDMHIDGTVDALVVGRQIEEFYAFYNSTNKTFTEYVEAAAVKFFSDTCFGRSVIKQAQLQSNSSDVYFYEFNYDGKMGDYNGTLPELKNVKHGEELNYLFSAWLSQSQLDNTDLSQFPESDVVTHNRLLRLWTNFAKYLNPTPEEDSLLQNLTWPKVDSEFQYLDIDTDLSIKKNPKKDMYSFWTALYDQYAVTPYDTY